MQVLPARRCVIVGVDGSPNSIAALRRAAAEARLRQARLDVVRILVPGSGAYSRPRDRIGEWLRLRSLVARTVPLSQHVTTRLRIARGRPGEVLSAASAHGELVVIGARAHSEYGNPLGGDTVPAVWEHTRCELIVCADQNANADPQ
ncbi:universal stress protein [Spirillospora sp. NPDC029432]|uniref:universal stress protein n=1 Tax=Spirillospora sp. NPDC029432 TaxID=3154599 RepID=UPI00345482D9